jgi:hypothetical protein
MPPGDESSGWETECTDIQLSIMRRSKSWIDLNDLQQRLKCVVAVGDAGASSFP